MDKLKYEAYDSQVGIQPTSPLADVPFSWYPDTVISPQVQWVKVWQVTFQLCCFDKINSVVFRNDVKTRFFRAIFACFCHWLWDLGIRRVCCFERQLFCQDIRICCSDFVSRHFWGNEFLRISLKTACFGPENNIGDPVLSHPWSGILVQIQVHEFLSDCWHDAGACNFSRCIWAWGTFPEFGIVSPSKLVRPWQSPNVENYMATDHR